MSPVEKPTQVDRDRAAKHLGYRDWDDATDYRLTGKQDRERDALVATLAAHRLAADQAARTTTTEGEAPIRMILHCPVCHLQHIDEPVERTPEWDNPPHRSHLCHGCGCIWRPADVPTEGVASLDTHGKADTWTAAILATPPATPAGGGETDHG